MGDGRTSVGTSRAKELEVGLWRNGGRDATWQREGSAVDELHRMRWRYYTHGKGETTKDT